MCMSVTVPQKVNHFGSVRVARVSAEGTGIRTPLEALPDPTDAEIVARRDRAREEFI